MKTGLGIILALFVSCFAWSTSIQDIIMWGYSGSNYAREWVDSTGRLGVQSLVNLSSSALTLWPTSGTKPTTDSISEVTLYRTLWSDATMERFNISAMATANGAAYRFGVERGNGGQFRDMIFCFEDFTPGVANCQLKVKSDGVYVTDDMGATWRKL